MYEIVFSVITSFFISGLFIPTVMAQPPASSPPVKLSTTTFKQTDIDILPANYYRDIAPTVNNRPVEVEVSVVILSMKLSAGSEQTFDVDIFYHNRWRDHRLLKPAAEAAIAHRLKINESMVTTSGNDSDWTPLYKLNDSWRNRLWVPDTYFRNAIRGSVSNILTPTYYFTVSNYTQVFMAVRLSLKLSCEMNFYKFPFDTQKCFLNITTTSEDNSTLLLKWHTFRVGSHVDVTEFTIVSVNKSECIKQLDIGYFCCLYGEIVFRRNIGNYLIKRFIPSMIIVVMSFLGFWIPTNVSPARTLLPIAALLALITQQTQAELNVSYVYSLQVWNMMCIIFVFANLLEFAIALYVIHMDHKRNRTKQTFLMQEKEKNKQETNHNQNKDDLEEQTNQDQVVNAKSTTTTSSSSKYSWRTIAARHFATTSRHSAVDKVSRYLFPICYAIFVCSFIIYFVE